MRKRNLSILIRLDTKEKQRLRKQVKKTGLSQEAYIRSLINGYAPREAPSLDFYFMMRELNAIGNNLNQIAARAHATGHIHEAAFEQEKKKLQKAVLAIQQAVLLPEKIQAWQ